MEAVILGALIGIAHHYSEKFCAKCRSYNSELISLSAGISVTYIFLDLFPQFSNDVLQSNKLLFISLLLGFVLFHLVEKYIYQHSPKGKLKRSLDTENTIASFTYHFCIGVILVTFTRLGIDRAILFFIPMILYTALSTLPVNPPKSKILHGLLSVSTVIGVLFAEFVVITPLIQTALVGFIIGILLFTVIRHSILIWSWSL
jgi:hypothetical protein